MQQTLKMLKAVVLPEHKTMEESQLLEEYKQTKNPSILAVYFLKYYTLTNYLADKFYCLPESDVSSNSLEILDISMLTFDKKKNTKFSSYYSVLLTRRFRTITQKMQIQVNYKKVRKQTVCFETIAPNSEKLLYEFEDDSIFRQDILSNSSLTDRELNYCKLAMDGNVTVRDMASMLQLHPTRIYKVRKSIQLKLGLQIP